MITQLIKFTAKADQAEAFTAALIQDRQGARKEAGNHTFKLYAHVENPAEIYAFEQWEDQAAIDHHMAQPYTKEVIELTESALAAPTEFLNLDEVVPAATEEMNAPSSIEDLVVIFFKIKIKDEFRADVMKEFPRQVALTREESGNLLFELYCVEGQEDTFVVYEYWENKAALDSHFQQPYSQEMGGLLTQAVDGPLPSFMSFVREIA